MRLTIPSTALSALRGPGPARAGRICLFALWWVATAAAQAPDLAYRRTVGGLEIYVGAVPAAIVRGHPEAHSERSMHGGRPERYDIHVVAAIFDAQSGKRIEVAAVSARAETSGGVWADQKPLQPMAIAGGASYGNYFAPPGKGPFSIQLTIRRPGEPLPTRARFEFVSP